MKKLLALSIAICGIGSASGQSVDTLKLLHRELKQAPANGKVESMSKLSVFHLYRGRLAAFPKSTDSALFYANKVYKIGTVPQKTHAAVTKCKAFADLDKMMEAQAAAKEAVALSEKTADYSLKADALVVMALCQPPDPKHLSESYKRAAALYQKGKNTKEEAWAKRQQAYWVMAAGNMDEGKKLLAATLQFYKSNRLPGIQKVLSLLCIANVETGNFPKALEYGLSAANAIDQTGSRDALDAEAYNFLAIAYNQSRNLDAASDYLKRAYEIAKPYKDKTLAFMALSNLVANLMSQQKTGEALTYLEAMQPYYDTLDEVGQSNIINRSLLAYSFSKQPEKAAKYARLAEEKMAKARKDDQMIRLYYPGLINYYFDIGNYARAKKLNTDYKLFSEKNKDKRALEDIHRKMYDIDLVAKDYKSALENYKIYRSYQDSLNNESTEKRIAEIGAKYETDKKDKANKLLQQQAKLQKSEIAQANLTRNISLAGLAAFLVLIVLLVLRYRHKQKTNLLLEIQKNDIDAKNASLEKLLQEKDWLVKEVHHRVKNNLQMVMSLLNAQSHYLQDEKASSAIRDSQHRIHSMSLIHKKLYQSDNVTTINTEVYINELIDYFRQSFNISQRIAFRTEIEPIELDASQAVPIGLILNEAITNSVKHAFPDGTGTISIYLLLLQQDKIRLQISDDGVGMADSETATAKTLGMRLMNGLSDDLDGKFTLDGQNGVTITLEFKLLQPVSKT